jgi:hypothetical protein
VINDDVTWNIRDSDDDDFWHVAPYWRGPSYWSDEWLSTWRRRQWLECEPSAELFAGICKARPVSFSPKRRTYRTSKRLLWLGRTLPRYLAYDGRLVWADPYAIPPSPAKEPQSDARIDWKSRAAELENRAAEREAKLDELLARTDGEQVLGRDHDRAIRIDAGQAGPPRPNLVLPDPLQSGLSPAPLLN